MNIANLRQALRRHAMRGTNGITSRSPIYLASSIHVETIGTQIIAFGALNCVSLMPGEGTHYLILSSRSDCAGGHSIEDLLAILNGRDQSLPVFVQMNARDVNPHVVAFHIGFKIKAEPDCDMLDGVTGPRLVLGTSYGPRGTPLDLLRKRVDEQMAKEIV